MAHRTRLDSTTLSDFQKELAAQIWDPPISGTSNAKANTALAHLQVLLEVPRELDEAARGEALARARRGQAPRDAPKLVLSNSLTAAKKTNLLYFPRQTKWGTRVFQLMDTLAYPTTSV